MKKRNIFIAVLVLVVIIIFGFFVVMNKQKASKFPQYPFKKIITKEFILKNNNMTIDVKYPYLGGGSVDKVLDVFIKSEISRFTKENDIKLSHNWKNEFYITYDGSYFSKDIISFKFELYQFTGGAHGNTRLRTYVLDINNGSEYRLSMLFDKNVDYLKLLSDISKSKIKKQLGQMADEKWISEGTTPKEANFNNVILTPMSMIIFFDQYKVASYATGIQQVDIKLIDIVKYLIPPMAKKVKARSTGAKIE